MLIRRISGNETVNHRRSRSAEPPLIKEVASSLPQRSALFLGHLYRFQHHPRTPQRLRRILSRIRQLVNAPRHEPCRDQLLGHRGKIPMRVADLDRPLPVENAHLEPRAIHQVLPLVKLRFQAAKSPVTKTWMSE